MSEARTCHAVWLGRLDYREALELQLQLTASKKAGLPDDFLLLLEHPPTITLGRNGSWRHLRVARSLLEQRGIARYEVDRGGDITFHGPGQLIGYPIFDLGRGERDVRRYMRQLEEVLIRVLSEYGINGDRRENATGVWTTQGKIAALGVHISRWITRHGFALNVAPDLSFFDLIVPCGLTDCRVTSMRSELDRRLEPRELAPAVAEVAGELMARRMVALSEDEFRSRWVGLAGAPVSILSAAAVGAASHPVTGEDLKR